MARWPKAIWQPVPLRRKPGDGGVAGGALNPIAVTLHHQAGNGNPYHVYRSRGVSAHFWIPRSGRPVQHVDTNIRSWHGVAHNGYSIGVETEGCGTPPHADPLNAHQLQLFAELMAWANKTHGIPLQLSEAVTQRGLNYHRARGGPATACPCSVRVTQRAEILRRARKGGAGTASPPPSSTVPPAQVPKMRVSWFGRNNNARHPDVRVWQQQMRRRGWTISVDGIFGPQSDRVARAFQREKAPAAGRVDGRVGSKTWRASFTAPIS